MIQNGLEYTLQTDAIGCLLEYPRRKYSLKTSFKRIETIVKNVKSLFFSA